MSDRCNSFQHNVLSCCIASHRSSLTWTSHHCDQQQLSMATISCCDQGVWTPCCNWTCSAAVKGLQCALKYRIAVVGAVGLLRWDVLQAIKSRQSPSKQSDIWAWYYCLMGSLGLYSVLSTRVADVRNYRSTRHWQADVTRCFPHKKCNASCDFCDARCCSFHMTDVLSGQILAAPCQVWYLWLAFLW